MKILTIEDDGDVQDMVSVAFDRYWVGSKVLAAVNGSQGLQLLQEEEPHIVILDLGLSDIDGLELCQKIRAHHDLPIVILTVKDRDKDVIEGLNAGAADYITKPFSPKDLIARVWAVARRHHLPDASTESPVPVFTDS